MRVALIHDGGVTEYYYFNVIPESNTFELYKYVRTEEFTDEDGDVYTETTQTYNPTDPSDREISINEVRLSDSVLDIVKEKLQRGQ